MAGTNGKQATRPVKPGRIIILNGPVSAGKTSMARAFQELATDPWLLFGIDNFIFEVAPDRFFEDHDQPATDLSASFDNNFDGFHMELYMDRDPPEMVWENGPIANHAITGLHAAIVALCTAGQNVIADHVLGHEIWLEDLIVRIQHLPAWFVGVTCPIPVQMERTIQRGDRPDGERGLALANWFERVLHQHRTYDLEIDTTTLSPEECAALIQYHLDTGPPPAAFRKLAGQFKRKEVRYCSTATT